LHEIHTHQIAISVPPRCHRFPRSLVEPTASNSPPKGPSSSKLPDIEQSQQQCQQLLSSQFGQEHPRAHCWRIYCSKQHECSAVSTGNRRVDLILLRNALMNKLLRGDLGGALSILTSNIVSLAFFIGPFLVPLLVFLFAWPFLCCCCCCPGSCPSKCCQQP
jgi:hypothetical protein